MEIKRLQSKEEAAAEAGEYLNAVLTENKKRPVLLMLSAGSALALLDYVGTSALGENLSVSMLDDRFSQEADVNNFLQLQKLDFYKDALGLEVSFFGSLPRKEDTMESLSARWGKNLKTWKEENPNGIIIATLGMGADGHTFGVLPYPEDPMMFKNLFQSDNWVRAYNAGNKNKFPERVTTTLTFLKLIDVGLAFVCGAEKQETLEKVIKKQGKVNELPALAWDEIKDVKLFTDIK